MGLPKARLLLDKHIAFTDPPSNGCESLRHFVHLPHHLLADWPETALLKSTRVDY
jgi:hypothetical protein